MLPYLPTCGWHQEEMQAIASPSSHREPLQHGSETEATTQPLLLGSTHILSNNPHVSAECQEGYWCREEKDQSCPDH